MLHFLHQENCRCSTEKSSISTSKTKECLPRAIILFSICILGNKIWKNISNYSFVHNFLALNKLHCHFRAWKKIIKIFSSRRFPVDLLLGNLHESWPAVITRPRGLMLTCERIHLLFDLIWKFESFRFSFLNQRLFLSSHCELE